MANSIKIAELLVASFLEGVPVRVHYPPFDVMVVKHEGEFYALEDACNHAGASLSGGPLSRNCIVCPMHGYLFSLRDGSLVAPKGLCGPQRTFRVELSEDEEKITLWDDIKVSVR